MHRDLKPANVRIAADGQVKVLDFGLAKSIAGGDRRPGTLTTAEGQVVGTPTYMAPEQVRGRGADRRVDVWAFGCVLYECLTGRRAFGGEELGEVLLAVMQQDPDWDAMPARTPAHVRALLLRCLDKDPRRRLRDIGEARVLLEGGVAEPVAPTTHRGIAPLAAAAAALAVVAVGAFALLSRPPAGAAVMVPRSVRVTGMVGMEEDPAISPDGQKIRRLVETIQVRGLAWLAGGSGLVYASSADSTMAYPPAFSLRHVDLDDGRDRPLGHRGAGYTSHVDPDVRGDHVVVSRVAMQSDVYAFAVDGAPTRRLADARRITRQTGQVQAPSVSSDGEEVCYLSDRGGHANVWVTSVRGDGEPRQITFEQDPTTVIGIPVWSPRRNWIVYYRCAGASTEEWLVSPRGAATPRKLVDAIGAAVWSPDGDWVYHIPPNAPVRDNGTARVRVGDDGRPVGEPEFVRETGVLQAIGPDGEVAFFLPGDGSPHELWRASPVGAPGAPFWSTSPSRIPLWPHHYTMSPDGRWLAAPFRDHGTTNLWLISTEDATEVRLTDLGGLATTIGRQVSWSPDGREVFAAVMVTDADIVLIEDLLP